MVQYLKKIAYKKSKTKSFKAQVRLLKKKNKFLIKKINKYKKILKNITYGIYLVKKDGTLLMANSILLKILGFSSFKEIAEFNKNRPYYNYLDSSTRSDFYPIISDEGRVLGFESKWNKADGSVVFLSETGFIIKDNVGNSLYYLGIIQDITLKKLLDVKLQKIKRTNFDIKRELYPIG